MTAEELDAAIAEIIILQEKPKSTQNSHRRKQWENKKYWRFCTVGDSCKLGRFKDKFKNFTEDDLEWYERLSSKCFRLVWIVYDFNRCYYKKYSYNKKKFRIDLNRRIRRTYKGEIGNYSYYKKIFEYHWRCI